MRACVRVCVSACLLALQACLDGSLPGFYIEKAKDASHANDWQLYFQGIQLYLLSAPPRSRSLSLFLSLSLTHTHRLAHDWHTCVQVAVSSPPPRRTHIHTHTHTRSHARKPTVTCAGRLHCASFLALPDASQGQIRMRVCFTRSTSAPTNISLHCNCAGGGWCYSEADCYGRSLTTLGSSKASRIAHHYSRLVKACTGLLH